MHHTDLGNMLQFARSDVYKWGIGFRPPTRSELLEDLSYARWYELPPIDVPDEEIWDHQRGAPESRMTERRLSIFEKELSAIELEVWRQMRIMHVGIDKVRWVAYLISEPKLMEEQDHVRYELQGATHLAKLMLFLEQHPLGHLLDHGIWQDWLRIRATPIDLEKSVRLGPLIEDSGDFQLVM